MQNSFIEAEYPIDFRKGDAQKLGEYLRHRQSVDLVGMKRVGISNFLRFFLYHREIVNTYISQNERHLFIPVDLNDLIERELFPFWILTFKRIVDNIDRYPIEKTSKNLISRLFLDAIQTKDTFLTLDGIRRSLIEIVRCGFLPTIFFLRFDRLKDAVTPEFFDNLQGLRDATAQKLSYVFTSFRTLNELVPSVFKKELLSVFTQSMYIKPAEYKDIAIIFSNFGKRYQLKINEHASKKILDLSGGHVQYLQLSLVILKEMIQKSRERETDIESLLLRDERINLQSEELWESLKEAEKDILIRTLHGKSIQPEDKDTARYLWDTGFILENDSKTLIFSPISQYFLKQKGGVLEDPKKIDFTKKENLLFNFLRENCAQLCDREKIIETVWSEYEEMGISDWAVDKLVARLRRKLKNKESLFEIITVKTRGYKLVETTKAGN